jgi:hypothetical protein
MSELLLQVHITSGVRVTGTGPGSAIFGCEDIGTIVRVGLIILADGIMIVVVGDIMVITGADFATTDLTI